MPVEGWSGEAAAEGNDADDRHEAPSAETAISPDLTESRLATLEARIQRLEKRSAKLVAIVISVIALVAPAASAVAAWMSWRTAHSSLEVAEDSADVARRMASTSGVMFDLSTKVHIAGRCDRPENPLVIVWPIQNSGRLPGRITGARFALVHDLSKLGIRPDPNDIYNPGIDILRRHADRTLFVIASTDMETRVEGNNSADLNMPADCAKINKVGLGGADAGKKIVDSIYRREFWWIAVPIYAYTPDPEKNFALVESADYQVRRP
ncbi:hypothetical protein [Mycobacterium sp. GA-2829]|uniref:hypothetical protein n=1 Tax=Mycobacterium sp. GA-2829 TaxID=1772283 RepID=UPI0012FA84F6|nr:hypothetical protein [Mycobacterium sp. GA-2829]